MSERPKAPVFDALGHRSVEEVGETHEKNILGAKRMGEPIYVSIEIQPLLFNNSPDMPDFMRYLERPPAHSPENAMAASYDREHAAIGHA